MQKVISLTNTTSKWEIRDESEKKEETRSGKGVQGNHREELGGEKRARPLLWAIKVSETVWQTTTARKEGDLDRDGKRPLPREDTCVCVCVYVLEEGETSARRVWA